MEQLDLGGLGLQQIAGGDVFGGEAEAGVPKTLAALIVCAAGYLVANWPDMKQGFADGFNNR